MFGYNRILLLDDAFWFIVLNSTQMLQHWFIKSSIISPSVTMSRAFPPSQSAQNFMLRRKQLLFNGVTRSQESLFFSHRLQTSSRIEANKLTEKMRSVSMLALLLLLVPLVLSASFEEERDLDGVPDIGEAEPEDIEVFGTHWVTYTLTDNVTNGDVVPH